MAPNLSSFNYLLNHFLSSNGSLMHLIKHMKTARDTQAPSKRRHRQWQKHSGSTSEAAASLAGTAAAWQERGGGDGGSAAAV